MAERVLEMWQWQHNEHNAGILELEELPVGIWILMYHGKSEIPIPSDLTSDLRFIDQDLRAKIQAELIPIIETWLQTLASNAGVWAYLEEHRVPSGPVLSPQDTINHEYAKHTRSNMDRLRKLGACSIYSVARRQDVTGADSGGGFGILARTLRHAIAPCASARVKAVLHRMPVRWSTCLNMI